MSTTQKGMLVDSSICIGCKACQVACKEWNQLPMEDEAAVHLGNAFLAESYDNTGHLSSTNWRHVKFIEQFDGGQTGRDTARWLMMSDSCKHCVQAGCLEVCPTGALFRTDFGAVDIHNDVCIGCRYCVGACPFGVISFNDKYDSNEGGPHMVKGTVNKCVLCSDRVANGLGTACAKACPTASITFGNLDDLKSLAASRIQALHRRGQTDAYVYGWDLKAEGYDRPSSGAQDVKVVGGLNVFYLLLDKPHVYGLPDHDPGLPQKNILPNAGGALVMAGVLGIAGVAAFRKRRMDAAAAPAPE
jgi:formate dehydrogenase iron-sulfur subunit